MMNVVLFGFMGTGKSTARRLVAGMLGYEFVDMDALIEQRTGRSIASIFAEDGEQAFRRLERELTQELSAQEGLVIATGGGLVLDADNISDMERSGFCIRLCATPEAILERTADESHRPLLEEGHRERRIRELMTRREPYYAKVTHQMDTDGAMPEQVAEAIVRRLRNSAHFD